MEQFPIEDDFENFLKQLKMNREEIAYILFLQDEITRDVPPVSEEDTKRYYEDNGSIYYAGTAGVCHILFLLMTAQRKCLHSILMMRPDKWLKMSLPS